mgnify:CR=1 FL=1
MVKKEKATPWNHGIALINYITVAAVELKGILGSLFRIN